MNIKLYQSDSSPLGYSIGIALDRFINSKQADFPYATGELSQILRDIALAAKVVNREINRAGLSNVLGGFGNVNIHGEEQ